MKLSVGLSKVAGFSKKELRMGQRTEMEHTDNRRRALEIAKDHLREDPHYYARLKKCMPGEVKSASAWDAIKGAVGLGKTLPRISSGAQQLAKDRALLRQGKKYVEIGTPPQAFNPSGFLRGTKLPGQK